MSLATFTKFPELPSELRRHIWRAALPERRSTLYPYKKGCWKFEIIVGPALPDAALPDAALPDAALPDPAADTGSVMGASFQFTLLDPAHVHVPLMHANYEARQVALTYGGEHGIQMRQIKNGGPPRPVRVADPAHDTLFLDPAALDDTFNEFSLEFNRRRAQLENITMTAMMKVHRVAVPESVFGEQDQGTALYSLVQYDFDQMFIIIGSSPELLASDAEGDDETLVQPHWELKEAPGGFTWNHSQGVFEPSNGQAVETQYEVIRRVCRGLAEVLKHGLPRQLAILPAFVIRR